jgi:hypothetical protein
MRAPNFNELRREREHSLQLGNQCDRHSYAQGVHPNPRFFKYYWWVFWTGSPVDGNEFLRETYRMSTAAAMALIAELQSKNEPYWLYNKKLPRRDPANPFDLQSPYWREWALPYDKDCDPIAVGDLAGHK